MLNTCTQFACRVLLGLFVVVPSVLLVAPASGQTCPNIIACAPTNIQATDATRCDGVRITWNQPATGPAPNHYFVWRCNVNDPFHDTFTPLTPQFDDCAGPTAGQGWLDTTAEPLVQYYYFVASQRCSIGTGDHNDIGEPGRRGALPATAPQSVRATDGDHCGFIRVTWSAVTGATPPATGYQVFRCSGTNCTIPTNPLTGADNVTDLFYDDSSANVDQTYRYWVKARNDTPGFGCGAGPASASDTGFIAPLPGAPTGVEATDGTAPCDRVTITWNPPSSGASSYQILRGSSSSCGSAAPIGTSFSPSFNDFPVPGTIYFYFVKARNSADCAGSCSGGDSGYRGIPPMITTQPTNLMRCAGTSASFSVAASGTPAPTFQWRRGATNLANGGTISGATSATLNISSVALGDAGTYSCMVSNNCGMPTSSGAMLTVDSSHTITSQPVPLTRCFGLSASFSVTASGCGPFTYSWRKGGAAISIGSNPTADDPTLSISNVTIADGGTYDCIVSNGFSQNTSSPATLTVDTSYSIVSHPVPVTRCLGQSASLSVVASGCGPFSYVWRKDGAPIPVGTNPTADDATLTISPVTLADDGTYDCVVSNHVAAIASNSARLTVNNATAPTISLNPQSETRCIGDNATICVTAAGTPPLTYQWRKNTAPISGATAACLVIPVVAAANAGLYDCVVTNSCGSATSSQATLSVNTPPSISTHPVSLVRCMGQTAAFSIGATGSPVLTYKWRKDGTDIAGATGSSLTIASVAASDVGSYDCVVTGAGPCPSVASNSATLDVYCQCAPSFAQTGGVDDSFSTANGAEATTPRPALTSAANGAFGLTLIPFDTLPAGAGGGSRRVLVHSFTGAPGDALSGTLRLRLRAGENAGGQAGTSDDTIKLGFANNTTNGGITTNPSTFWSSPISMYHGGTWNTGDELVLTLDLVAITTGTGVNVLAGINANGYLDLLVENKTGVDYATISLTRPQPPQTFPRIVAHPSSITRCNDSPPVQFSVSAVGGTLSYQWYKNGNPIPNAVSSTYQTLGSLNLSDAGDYSCAVTNSCGTMLSRAATLTVLAWPGLVSGPEDQIVCRGAEAVFTVAVSGPNLAYLWRFNNTILSETSPTLRIASAATGDEGLYTCFVSNLCATVTSRIARLTVGGPTCCVADFDDGSGTGTPDGGVGIEDLLYYLSQYDAGVVRADVDDGSGTGTPDGGVGIEDLLYYLGRYDAGC